MSASDAGDIIYTGGGPKSTVRARMRMKASNCAPERDLRPKTRFGGEKPKKNRKKSFFSNYVVDI